MRGQSPAGTSGQLYIRAVAFDQPINAKPARVDRTAQATSSIVILSAISLK